MNPSDFDALAIVLPDTPSRRGALRSLGGGLLAAASLALTGQSSSAKKKKKKKRRPKAKFAGGCSAAPGGNATEFGNGRLAQTFIATRSGTLDEIRVAITKAPGTAGNWIVQMVPIVGGVPEHEPTDVFAAAAIDDEDVPDGDSTLRARFRGISILEGFGYAVVVTRSGGALFTLRGGSGCDNGQSWLATSTSTFSSAGSNFDFLFSVFVV
jgi:hypothetical protein